MSMKVHAAVRLDDETLTRIDAIRPLLDSEWRVGTRSDVLRLLIVHSLKRFERKHRAELGVAPSQGGSAEDLTTPAKRSRKRRAPRAG